MALTLEENETLTRVGPGTPCGELLRRYWHPVAIAAKLDENPVQRVRILCEDLVLYRDRSGTLGLIGDRCAHRLVNLEFGIPEAKGLRCPYHGWCYDETGQCIETPLESPNSHLKESIKLTSYPVEEMGGLIFAYLGPTPVPVLPRWDLFVREDGFRQIFSHHLPCNWLQVAEARGDHGHVVYLHGRLFQYALERQGELTDDPHARYNELMNRQAERLSRGAYQRFRPIYNQFGFTKAHLDFDQDESSPVWQNGTHPLLFPYMIDIVVPRNPMRFYQLGVPIDDTHTWHINYDCFVFPPEIEMPEQKTVPYIEVPLKDENGEYIRDYVLAQDTLAWFSQGEISDRQGEHIAASDACLSAYRTLLTEQIEKVRRGEEPMNVFHTPEEADRPDLRIEGMAEHSLEYSAVSDINVGGSLGTPSSSPQNSSTAPSFRVNSHKTSRPGKLNIDDYVERFSPDREVLVEAYRQLDTLSSSKGDATAGHAAQQNTVR